MKKWTSIKLGDALDYVQPTKFIVKSTHYNDVFETPVLTPGKSFILGYTNETDGIYSDVPTIIFDDFTTAFKYVDFPFKVKSSAMKMLKTKSDEFDIRFLYYLMLTLNFDADEHKRFWISKYSKQLVKLPPLPQQKKIAAILDAADAYRSKTKALIAKYNKLSQSLFLDMFGDPVTNPKGWEVKSMSECYINKKDGTKCGPFGSALKKHEYSDNGVPVWTMFNIKPDGFNKNECLFITQEKFNELESYSTKLGDIIISRAGTVGKMCVITYDKEAIISTNLIRLRLNSKIMIPMYFSLLMNKWGSKVARLKTGAEGAFTHMNTGILNSINIPIPPLKLQNQFAERIEAIEAQKAKAEASLAKAEDLFASLLQRAFKGELT